ncbi:folylpolyglutamate synthase/dihydrofolate synthase family protein [uncultured Peptoniphilus sp.]|uniref:bifunctional folylpolyglutamate synthase/dihydrofolate synthase n=1 Tax=uncultured Peptoniphilus sp. TaxID=254354 RepID=UPI002806581B|nr:folylpolyglutamate synthase/dihydrofolate synthase family protein [uncultured Peptoniphilus sp.]
MNEIDWLLNRETPMVDFSTENISLLLELLNRPQDKIKTLHVTGTNAKGSVVSFLKYAMAENSYRVGAFTSPFISNINECIEINEEKISDEDYEKILREIHPLVNRLDKEEKYVTGFEIQVACAFLYFYKKKVSLAIIEVGLGGRFDATNVMKKPLAAIFTPISYDHINILGKSLKEIAWNKGGIIKDGVPSFSYPQRDEAFNELVAICQEKNSNLVTFEMSDVKNLSSGIWGNSFDFMGFKNVKTSLIGNHQAYNASLALLILDYLKKYYKLDDEKIKSGIERAKNTGRLEIISRKPLILIDGAHNMEAIDALLENLKKFSYRNLILGFSILRDKDRENIIEKMVRISKKIVLTEIDSFRKSEISDLVDIFEKFSGDDSEIYKDLDVKKAFEKSLELAGDEDLILWCGSFYLIKEIRKFILEE